MPVKHLKLKRYTVTFYQCAVDGREPERYSTKRKAQRAAVEFLQSFEYALTHGHRYAGSVYRNGYAAIVDRMNATEALAEIHDNRSKPHEK